MAGEADASGTNCQAKRVSGGEGKRGEGLWAMGQRRRVWGSPDLSDSGPTTSGYAS